MSGPLLFLAEWRFFPFPFSSSVFDPRMFLISLVARLGDLGIFFVFYSWGQFPPRTQVAFKLGGGKPASPFFPFRAEKNHFPRKVRKGTARIPPRPTLGNENPKRGGLVTSPGKSKIAPLKPRPPGKPPLGEPFSQNPFRNSRWTLGLRKAYEYFFFLPRVRGNRFP